MVGINERTIVLDIFVLLVFGKIIIHMIICQATIICKLKRFSFTITIHPITMQGTLLNIFSINSILQIWSVGKSICALQMTLVINLYILILSYSFQTREVDSQNGQV